MKLPKGKPKISKELREIKQKLKTQKIKNGKQNKTEIHEPGHKHRRRLHQSSSNYNIPQTWWSSLSEQKTQKTKKNRKYKEEKKRTPPALNDEEKAEEQNCKNPLKRERVKLQ